MSNSKPKISIIVAMDKNNLIGDKNNIPWHIPGELKRFRNITMGKPIIMGRKTHESIGRVLDGRENIVLTKNDALNIDHVKCYTNLNRIICDFEQSDELMIIGGAEIYKLTLPFVDKLYLTIIDSEFTGDTWFPSINFSDWNIEESEDISNTKINLNYSFKTYIRSNG